MMKKIIIIFTAAALLPVMIFAQPSEKIPGQETGEHRYFQPPPHDGKPGGRMNPRQMKRLEKFQIMKMIELLELDDASEEKLKTAFRTHKKDQQSLMQERRELVEQLAREVRGDNPSTDKLTGLMESLDAYDDSLHFHRKQFFNQVSEFLTPAQMGRLYVFQTRFANQVFGKMREFHKEGRQGDRMKQREKFDKENNTDGN